MKLARKFSTILWLLWLRVCMRAQTDAQTRGDGADVGRELGSIAAGAGTAERIADGRSARCNRAANFSSLRRRAGAARASLQCIRNGSAPLHFRPYRTACFACVFGNRRGERSSADVRWKIEMWCSAGGGVHLRSAGITVAPLVGSGGDVSS